MSLIVYDLGSVFFCEHLPDRHKKASTQVIEQCPNANVGENTLSYILGEVILKRIKWAQR